MHPQLKEICVNFLNRSRLLIFNCVLLNIFSVSSLLRDFLWDFLTNSLYIYFNNNNMNSIKVIIISIPPLFVICDIIFPKYHTTNIKGRMFDFVCCLIRYKLESLFWLIIFFQPQFTNQFLLQSVMNYIHISIKRMKPLFTY